MAKSYQHQSQNIVDTRDQALTKLTRLHDESHPTLTDQRAYEGITHSLWGASWNWRWRRVGDDEDQRSPSLEPQTDSRSGLPMKNRRWGRLRLVKCDNSFSLIFLSNNMIL